MWFRNLQVYRLGILAFDLVPFLTEALQPHAFTPIGNNETKRQGWAPVLPIGGLVHAVNRQLLLRLDTEEKVVPGAVINRVAKARAAELEEQQGFPPGKKAMKELKERVADELLPRAFPRLSSTLVWIDPVNGWLVVDASSPAKADEVIKLLLKADSKFPLESLRVASSPTAVMTSWLESDEAPHNFTIDQDAELRATGESRAAIKWVRHTLDPEELRRHIAAGKQCVRLAMTWNSRVSFVLDESLAIKSVRPLDVIRENEAVTYDDQERFDNDVVLMTGELNKLLADLTEALGGMVQG
jgi:recombination associated protein RdgC